MFRKMLSSTKRNQTRLLLLLAVIFLNKVSLTEHVSQSKTEKSESKNCLPLNKFINCYKYLSFSHIKHDHEMLYLTFSAFGQQMTLVLQSKKDGDSNDEVNIAAHHVVPRILNVTVIDNTGRHVFDHSSRDYYYGFVKDEAGSVVKGRFSHGIFNGKVKTPSNIYYIEESGKYFHDQPITPGTEMVIYKESDIVFWKFKSAYRKASPVETKYVDHRFFNNQVSETELFSKVHGSGKLEEYELHLNLTGHTHKRNKRSTTTLQICEVAITADHLFFQHVGLNSVDKTVAEIVQYIQESDELFRRTDFNGDESPDNVGFTIISIEIYQTENAVNNIMGSSNDVDIVLDNFSKYDHSSACLGLLFTHRDFANGVIGLAWVGSSSLYSNPGGICQARLNYNGILMSFNSLLVSTFNFAARVPPKVSELTTAHEFGHAFGSPHDVDSDPRCAPDGLYGHYLMHPYSSDASKPNNYKFSPCSVASIAPVIVTKSPICFTSTQAETCGNQIVEDGEECDCGTALQCSFIDKCCNSNCEIDTGSGYVCSALKHDCCDGTTCQVKTGNEACREATECAREAICNGVDATCPAGEYLSDGTPCHGGTKVCQNGECTKSICEHYGLEECHCTTVSESLCDVCCQCANSSLFTGGSVPTCVPAWILDMHASTDSRIYRIAGTSCNNFRGYCNVNHSCIGADEQSVIDRLDAFFSDRLVDKLSKIGQNYWIFVVVIAAVTLVVAAAVKANYKKIKASTNKSIQVAKLSIICIKAQSEYTLLDEQLDDIHQHFNQQVDQLGCYAEMDTAVAMGRISTFFPTASKADIRQTLQEASNEEDAVRYLLLRGFPLRKLFDESDDDRQVVCISALDNEVPQDTNSRDRDSSIDRNDVQFDSNVDIQDNSLH